jgi:hypothetical protein
MYQTKNPVNAYALTGFLIFGAAGRDFFPNLQHLDLYKFLRKNHGKSKDTK